MFERSREDGKSSVWNDGLEREDDELIRAEPIDEEWQPNVWIVKCNDPAASGLNSRILAADRKLKSESYFFEKLN
jgi:hypothetical protein